MPAAATRRRILVTGGAGYLGSVLVPQLLEAGSEVTVLDLLLFGDAPLAAVADHPGLMLLRGDICDADARRRGLQGADTVVHLASVSNNPSCDLDPTASIQTNLLATQELAREARAASVRHLVFMSSCSVYGARGSQTLDEGTPTGPVTLYALTKLAAETELRHLAGPDFRVTILRLATLFGLSPRMRFDLAINGMVRHALREGRIVIHGDGQQVRPFLHVRDAAETIGALLDRPPGADPLAVLNVGRDEMNYRIGDLARAIGDGLPGVTLDHNPGAVDIRSYRVAFQRARDAGLLPRRTVADAVDEITAAYRAGHFGDTEAPRYYNVLQMRSEQPPLVVASPVSRPGAVTLGDDGDDPAGSP